MLVIEDRCAATLRSVWLGGVGTPHPPGCILAVCQEKMERGQQGFSRRAGFCVASLQQDCFTARVFYERHLIRCGACG
jgi:hypothetical protein